MITIQKITTKRAFEKLEGEWSKLLQTSSSDTLVLTHAWLSTWWDVFRGGRQLYLLLAREEGKLVGIAPLLKRRVRQFGVSLRRIEFLASGEDEADEICSDYLDFIIESGRENEVLSAFLDYLGRDKGWDELLLTDVAGESTNLSPLRALSEKRGWNYAVTREQICIFVPIPPTRDELVHNISGQRRRRLNKDRRTFSAENMRTELVNSSDGFEAAFQTVVDLHQERWVARGFPGSFASAKFTRFHRAIAPDLLAKKQLNIWILWQDETPLCATYDFVYGGKMFHYQGGLSLKETPLIGPGMLLWDFSAEEGMKHGLTECDFLKGEVGSYKTSWGGKTRPILQVRLARRGYREVLLQGVNRAVEALRPLRRRVLQRLKAPQK